MEPQKATSAATDVLSRQTVTLRKLSVIVLSYNTRETTIRCIRSLFKHAPTTAELETVVIDNASSDGSAEAIARLFPRIKLIRNAKNRGFAAACNQGIRSSDGDILLLLNSDTELTDQSLDIMLDFLERNSDVGIAGGAMIGPDGRHQTSCQHYPSYTNLLFSKQSLFMSFKAFRKKYSKYRRIPGAITDVDAVAGGEVFHLPQDVVHRTEAHVAPLALVELDQRVVAAVVAAVGAATPGHQGHLVGVGGQDAFHVEQFAAPNCRFLLFLHL